MAANDRRAQSESQSHRDESRRMRREAGRDPGRAQGPWPYGLSALGYRGPATPGYPGGYPGYPTYPWSRFSHGMDPSYEDWQGPGFGAQGTGGAWEPPTQTYERDEKLVVRLELPGWDKDEVTVSAEDDELVVEGLREEEREGEEREERGRRAFVAERFRTRIPLPAPVDPDLVKAKFKNGVLEIRIPMPERRTERRRITIDT